MLKKIVCLALACLLLSVSLVSCGRGGEEEAELSVVCTVFPLYDWTRQVLGEESDAEIFWLTDRGTDLHSYQPSAEDMVRIASADLLIYVGGPSDVWVREALKNSPDTKALALSELAGIRHAAVSSQSGHSHEDGHDHEIDEHIWLSLRNACVSVHGIGETLAELDGERGEIYRTNAQNYVKKLEALDSSFAESVAKIQEPRVIFADRFPFVYLTEDYGIAYEAAFSGCTTDVDADLPMVIRLAERAKEWNVRQVLVTESSDGSLAESVIRATGRGDLSVARMNSLQSVDAGAAAEGVTYLSVMEENLTVLRRVLSPEGAEE